MLYNNVLESKIISNLFEGKQVGTLYHFTNVSALVYILYQNRLKAGNEFGEYFVSLTRDSRLNMISGGYADSMSVCFTMDGNSLSDNYKIVPLSYFNKESLSRGLDASSDLRHSVDNESEERVICPSGEGISSIRKYIKNITIYKKFFYEELENFSSDFIKALKTFAIYNEFQFEDKKPVFDEEFLSRFSVFLQDAFGINVIIE